MAYDYIIVGAGTAGCIVAARLSENPSRRVLLIEAGGPDKRLIVEMPAALPFAYTNKSLGWGYISGPEPHLDGRTIDEKRGRVIGGSSSINAMIYNRGNPLDFEGWASHGLSAWDYSHCLPYFRRMETFEGGADSWRGAEGPMFVSRCRGSHRLDECFLRGGEQAGYRLTKDHNGFKQEGLHIAQAFVHNGLRWSTARGYLHPAVDRPNLDVVSNALVRCVTVENGVATGVEFEDKNGIHAVTCDRELILSAGAFNTPQLLMLSGIGNADELRELGVELKAHVPEVGRNLGNHTGVNIEYATRYEDSLVSDLGLIGRIKLGADWLIRKKGLGTTNFFETGAFLRTRDDVPMPNIQLEFLPLTRRVKNGKLVAAPGFQVWVDLSRPESRGFVRLQSADPAKAPKIVFNHLASPTDIRDLCEGVRVARTFIRQAAWKKVRGAEITPGPDVQSDVDLERFLRASASSAYHPCGTCRMGGDADAVVDPEGRVRAVRRMRIVDASIMPRIVTGNPSAAIMMMAEKISDHILGREPLTPSGADFYRATDDAVGSPLSRATA